MNNGSDKKKEAPGLPDNRHEIELPGAANQAPKKETGRKNVDDEEAAGQQDDGNPTNQSGKNNPPESED